MLAAIQDARSQFISRIIRKGDEALVMSFDSNVDLLSDFTDERSQLERAIRKSRINVPDQGARVGNPGPIGSRQITGFFFQAEDGIRDDLVTGVQTCALPI